MRDLCPICRENNKRDEWQLDFIVPDGWTLPTQNTVCLCLECGFIWYNNDATPEDYATYYREKYGSDGGLKLASNYARLTELVDLICSETMPDDRIVDFGGGEGFICSELAKRGYTDAHTVDVGDPMPQEVDLIVSSHVFEHLYDPRETLETLIRSLNPGGSFLIELPDADGMASANWVPLLDYHQKHINHFIPTVLDALFRDYGFERGHTEYGKLETSYPYIYRVVYSRNISRCAYLRSKLIIQSRMAQMAATMNAISEPVIVRMNIVRLVDKDPAFIGQTVMGMPVYPTVEGDETIVVLANNRVTEIVQNIKDLGLINRVIVP
jgi:SAM-dependent methyltransferase